MYFICLVVILRVVFEDFGFLFVIEVAGKVIEVEVFAPFLGVDKPISISVYVVCGSCEESHIFSESATSNLRARRNRS